MQEESLSRKGQVLLTADADACVRVRELFPDFPVCTPDFISALDGRDVILMGCPELGEQCKGAKSLAVIPNEIPYPLAPEGAIKWAKAHKIPYISESTPESSEAATPNPASSGSSSQDVDTAEPAAKGYEPSPVGAVPGFPDAADPVESAPPGTSAVGQSVNTSTSVSKSGREDQAGADSLDPDDYRLIPAIINDTAFLIRWQALTFEQREALGEVPAERAIRLQMQDMADETHVARAIAASQDAETDPLGGDPDLDVPMGHPAAESPPVPDSEPPNGYDSQEPSRIWVKPLSPAEEWGHPAEVFGEINAPAELDPAKLFTGPLAFIADYAADCSELKGTDRGIATSGVLTSLSAWVHESFRMQIKRLDPNWKEAARLWICCVGESATGKTPAQDLAIAPAKALNKLAGEQDAKILAKYLSDKRIYDLKVADYEKRAAQNKLNAGEQMPDGVDSVELDNRMFSAANVEGARDKLQTCPKLWLVTPELASWLGSFGRYSNNKTADAGDRAFWMQSFDGGTPAPELRAGRVIQVKSLSCVIQACITGSGLRRALGGAQLEGDGLAQRFIMSNCRDQRQDTDREQDLTALTAMVRALSGLRAMRPIDGLPLRLAPDAYACFQAFQARLMTLASSPLYSPNCHSALMKYQSHCPRIALTLHLAMRAEGEQLPAAGEYVGLDTMETAVRICEAWIPHTIYFYENTIGESRQIASEITSICEVITCYHLGEKGTISLRDIRNSWKSWDNLDQRTQARLMAILQDMAWVIPSPNAKPRGGGLVTSYVLNPRLHKIYDQHSYVILARKRRAATGQNFALMRDRANQERDQDSAPLR